LAEIAQFLQPLTDAPYVAPRFCRPVCDVTALYEEAIL
jgi:hypothetical protein